MQKNRVQWHVDGLVTEKKPVERNLSNNLKSYAMKTLKNISIYSAAMLLVFLFQTVNAGAAGERKKSDQQPYLTIKGKVIDSETGVPLVFASVAVTGANVAIVTNIDGEFSLKIGESLLSRNLEISYIGYKNKEVLISSLRNNGYKNVISLESAPIPIKEIIVKPINPDEIVSKTIARIKEL